MRIPILPFLLCALPVQAAAGPQDADPSTAEGLPYKSRLAGRRDAVRRGGGGADTEDAVLAALKWLSRHQSADGSWKVKGYAGECNKIAKYGGGKCSPSPGNDEFDAGVTGLSVLAFLGSGYSLASRDVYDGLCFGDVVHKGLEWMIARQDPEGCIGSRTAQKYMYGHAVCATALAEAAGFSAQITLKRKAQKAIDFTVAAQNPSKGWRYSFRSGDNDTSVTGWCVSALKAAEASGLSFPRRAFDGARAWLDEVTEVAYGRAGYTHPGTGKVYIPRVNEDFEHHEALTAIAVMARLYMDKNRGDTRLSGGCDLLLRDRPKWDGTLIDFYYWYYASLALFQLDGPSGEKWKFWNKDLKDALVKNQNAPASGCRAGSWEPVDRWSCEGGRVYATAINALTLETYYRYARVSGK
jgi:hypothetical protein